MCKAVEILESLTDITNEISTYQKELSKKLSQYDLMEQDVLHKIENTNFNAVQGYKYAKMLKDIRQNRRTVKNEIELIKPLAPLQQSIVDRINKANTTLKQTEDRLNISVYHPRILKAI